MKMITLSEVSSRFKKTKKYKQRQSKEEVQGLFVAFVGRNYLLVAKNTIKK